MVTVERERRAHHVAERSLARASRPWARSSDGDVPLVRAPPALRRLRVRGDISAEASQRELIDGVGGAIGVEKDESVDQLAIG
jgi:hypothetical protein